MQHLNKPRRWPDRFALPVRERMDGIAPHHRFAVLVVMDLHFKPQFRPTPYLHRGLNF
jgi:hypothetical protein